MGFPHYTALDAVPIPRALVMLGNAVGPPHAALLRARAIAILGCASTGGSLFGQSMGACLFGQSTGGGLFGAKQTKRH